MAKFLDMNEEGFKAALIICGIQKMLSQIEAGKKFPSFANALMIAKEFNCTVDELAGDLL